MFGVSYPTLVDDNTKILKMLLHMSLFKIIFVGLFKNNKRKIEN